jgi:hypothetical protein
MKTDHAPGRLFNFDAHYGKNKDAYLDALRSVRRETWSQETWIRYFLDGLASEYERVAAEIDRLGAIGRTAGGQRIQLSENQQKGLSDLMLRNVAEFKRRDYEDAAAVSRNTAIAELNQLAEAGVLQRLDDGPSRRYRLPTAAAANPWTGRGGGRPRVWSDDRIEHELRELVGDGDRFPQVAEFKAAGKGSSTTRPTGTAARRSGPKSSGSPRRRRRRNDRHDDQEKRPMAATTTTTEETMSTTPMMMMMMMMIAPPPAT